MFSGNIDYTICSTDEDRYNRINCNLTAPVTKYSSMIITCLTTNCNIVILDTNDYFMIDGKRYNFRFSYSNLNLNTFVSLLNYIFEVDASMEDFDGTRKKIYTASLDNANRLVLTSKNKFYIDRMTYNCSLITGFYNSTFPIYADYDEATQMYFIKAKSVGFTLLTPVLYLVSNVAIQSYRNMNKNELTGAKIVMRINNTFSADTPIIVNNADFMTTLPSNDLSNLELTLVDANMHEVHLLSPMYISINVRAVPDEEIPSAFMESVMQDEREKQSKIKY